MKTIELAKKIEELLSKKSKEIGIYGTTPFILPKSDFMLHQNYIH